MKAMYICDNREEWRSLSAIFGEHFSDIELITAINGTDAFNHLLTESAIAMIFIESTLEEGPIALGHSLAEKAGQRPIVFVGTSEELQNTGCEEASNNDKIFSVYQKPYNTEIFKQLVKELLEWEGNRSGESNIVEIDRANYLPMRLRSFYLFDQVPYDALVELTKTKFIRVINKNERYTTRTLNQLSRRNIKFLYLEKTSYVRFLEDSIKRALETLNKKVDMQQTLHVQIASVLLIQQYINEIGISESIVLLTEAIIKATKKNFENYNNLGEILKIFPLEEGDPSEQAVLVSYACEAVSKGIGWNSDISRKRLGLASILHDFALTNSQLFPIISTQSDEFKSLPKKLQDDFFAHPSIGAKIASQFLGFSDVEFIIEEHHELPDGSGFPNGKNANALTSISCVFIISSNFVINLASKGISKKSVSQIIKSFTKTYNVGNFKDPLKALYTSVKSN